MRSHCGAPRVLPWDQGHAMPRLTALSHGHPRQGSHVGPIILRCNDDGVDSWDLLDIPWGTMVLWTLSRYMVQRSNPSFQDSATLHLPYARECAVHECELDRRNNDTCLQYLRNWSMVYLLWQFAALQLSTHVPALQTDKIPLAWPCLVTTNCRRGAYIYVNMHMYVSMYIYMCVCVFTVYTYMHYITLPCHTIPFHSIPLYRLHYVRTYITQTYTP